MNGSSSDVLRSYPSVMRPPCLPPDVKIALSQIGIIINLRLQGTFANKVTCYLYINYWYCL
jgi:hypothetical protein